MNKIVYILYLLLCIVALSSCSDVVKDYFDSGDIEQGEAIMFTTMVPDVRQSTKAAKDDWLKELESYKAVNREYIFNIEMWKEGASEFAGTSTYKPLSKRNIINDYDGTLELKENAVPLYWQDNVNHWGFKATAGTEQLEADQSNQTKWLAQDKLVGYSYLPIWIDGEERETDNVNAINYRTSKEWYADNKTAKEMSGLMVSSNDDYKKIPLYLQHQRSWITIILKAGEGVTREALAYATSAQNIQTTIYGYKDGDQTPMEINAWSSEERINYDADKNGDAASDVSTTRYDAIIEPHNFIASRENEERDIIARINVSNQRFSFAAANDINYAGYIADGGTEEAKKAMQVYNLQPGKHLTITATLSRASRMIMITAWIEDWTETITQTICDDYGHNGDPILINNRKELIAFLTDPDKNKAGNVGLIVPNAMSLDPGENDPGEWDGSGYTLNATLNLASATLSTQKQLVNAIARTGSIINGEVKVSDQFNAPSAIANTNEGTVERVRVTTSGELTPARASKAGLVDINYGTIYQCSSALPVYGTTGYVGGIAAQSLFKESETVSPVIDACTVTARVDGSDNITAGGGIVGQAEGRVSFNTFEYGVTLLQVSKGKFYNIIAAIGGHSQGLSNHSNNSWPTTEQYTVQNTSTDIINSTSGIHYNAVIDCRDELKEVLKSGNNQAGMVYRLANSFSVDKENWIWGVDDVLNADYFATNSSTLYANGTLKCKLDGNDKTITLTGTTNATMLFGSIIGDVYDLSLVLDKPIVADRITNINGQAGDSNTDAIAAFAYAITETGKIRNISLKAATSDVYIESSTPGGIAVWASHGGELTGCVSNVSIRMHLTTDGTDARHYAGGIVACAEKATITQCRYYSDNGVGWASGDDATKAQKNNSRYGGIVGGTSEIANSSTTPNLVLTDCYSWWNLPTFDSEVNTRPVMGSLIGSTVYHDPNDNTRLFNAMADNNAGNWWVGTDGAGSYASGVTDEKAIGRKNSVQPTKPQGW